METTRLSSKGQVIIPKALRSERHWQTGIELVATMHGDGILLRPKAHFPRTTLAEVGGCLGSDVPAKSLEEMQAAVRRGLKAKWR